MQILISCAKTMTGTAAVAAPRTTRPLFEAEAAGLALRLAALPAGELERMLRVNPRIAAENRRRYQIGPEHRNRSFSDVRRTSGFLTLPGRLRRGCDNTLPG